MGLTLAAEAITGVISRPGLQLAESIKPMMDNLSKQICGPFTDITAGVDEALKQNLGKLNCPTAK